MSAELNGNLTPEEQLTGTLDTSAQLVGRLDIGAGSGGTDDYNDLSNKPSINNVTLSGNKTTSELGLFSGNYNDLTNKPTIPTHLNQLSDVHYDPEDLLPDDILIWVNNGWYPSTQSYQLLANKPEINGHTLTGNKTTADLGLFSGDYDDLTNKPTIPAAQVNSDWNSSSGVSQILNKPLLPDFNTTNPSSLYTVTKTEGEWSFDSLWSRKAGNIIYMSMYFKGSGNIVNAGSNAFKGTLSGGPLPIGGATLVSYIDAACMVCTINSSGNITIRITGSSVTLASNNTAGFQGLMLIATS